jgi:hypothetical protein
LGADIALADEGGLDEDDMTAFHILYGVSVTEARAYQGKNLSLLKNFPFYLLCLNRLCFPIYK